MRVFACGSNLHQQLTPSDHVLQVLQPIEILPDKAVDAIVAISSCQIAYACKGALQLTGFRPDSWPALRADNVKRLLGKNAFRAYIDASGRICHLYSERTSSAKFFDADMDSHGHILAVEQGSHELHFFNSLDDLLAPDSKYEHIKLDTSLRETSSIHAGAAHFIIHVSGSNVFGLGDNRHFQQGHSGRSAWSAAVQIAFFEGGESIKKIACGDLHTAIVTADGALYMAGSNAKGQCGGFGDQEPSLVEFANCPPDEQPDVLDVACGSNHTIILTDKGVMVTGSNHVGQLATNGQEDVGRFTPVSIADNVTIRGVSAASWSSLFIA